GEDPDKPIKQDSQSRKKDTEMDSAARADAEISIGRIFMDADAASSSWVKKARRPWEGDTPEPYARRVGRAHQRHSPAWAKVTLDELSGQAVSDSLSYAVYCLQKVHPFRRGAPLAAGARGVKDNQGSRTSPSPRW